MSDLTRTIGQSSDDCSKYYTSPWQFSLTVASRVGYVNPTSRLFDNGLRFTNITIPKDTVITSAKIVFTADTSLSTNTVKSRFYGEATDDPATFSDLTDYNARSLTTAYVEWNAIGAWVAESTYDSPDLKTIIQELVNRAGWVSGNDLVIFWKTWSSDSTSGVYRSAYSYDTGAAKVPSLYIEYESGGGGYSNKFCGVSIGSICGISSANISKVCGV